jgi:hypothetical protein
MRAHDYARTIDDLDAAICTLAAKLNAETHRLLTLVREFDDRRGWAKWSFRNCAEWLAWRCGLSLSAAREKVRTAQALRDLPAIGAAFAEGRLSYSKVRALTRVVEGCEEAALLEYALNSTAAQVEERCRELRNARPESVEIAQRAWERRALSLFRDAARGVMRVSVELPIEEGEVLAQALDRAVAAGEAPAGIEFEANGWRAQQADALVAIAKRYLEEAKPSAEGSSSTADRYQVVVHVDESALRGGLGRADLPVDTMKRLACDGSLVTVTEDPDGTPLDVGRKQRTVSAPLKRALWARDRGCSFPGCDHQHYVDAHHIEHWAEGGATSLENLTLLCAHHHRLLHEGRFTVRRDAERRLYFQRRDGRVIPRFGYRLADMQDDFEPSETNRLRLGRRNHRNRAHVRESLNADSHLQVGLRQRVQEAGLLSHVERRAREVVVLAAVEEDVRLDRVGTPRFARAAAREMRVLHDAVAVEVLVRDLGVAAELRHETERNAGRQIARGIGRPALTAAAGRLVAEKLEDRAMRVEQLLLDLFDAVVADRADATQVQQPILLLGQAVIRERHRMCSLRRHTAASNEARPIAGRRHRRVEQRRGIRGDRAVHAMRARRLDPKTVVNQREQALLGTTQQAVHRRSHGRVRDEPHQSFAVGVARDLGRELHVLRAAGHRAFQRRADHRVVVVLHQPYGPELDAAPLRERQNLVHERAHHSGRHERQRTRCRIETGEVGALVAGQAPDGAGPRRRHERFLLHEAQRAHAHAQRIDQTRRRRRDRDTARSLRLEEQRLAALD